MTRFAAIGNICLIEIEEGAENPTIQIDKKEKSVIWISGFKRQPIPVIPAIDAIIRVDAKGFTFSKVVGKWDAMPMHKAKKYSNMVLNTGFDPARVFVLELVNEI
jgi:hypothetical protein